MRDTVYGPRAMVVHLRYTSADSPSEVGITWRNMKPLITFDNSCNDVTEVA